MHQETELITETRLYAEQLLQKCSMGKFPYHNQTHTHTVVEAVREIGEKSGLSKKDLETVEVAAWLHDIGLTSGKAEGHEQLGAEMARTFLAEHLVGEHRIEKVVNCILATKMPQQPENLLAEVLCDADLYHLSTDIYLEKAELLRQEFCMVKQGDINEKDWLNTNIQFLQSHTYFTAYGRETLQPRQDKNLRKLEKKVRKQQEQASEGESKSKWEKKNEALKARLEQEKQAKPGRGVETMFRTTAANHLHLSEMADNKANIMISINSIIVSLMVTVLIRKFEEFPNLIIPTAILTIVCLVTIVFAVLATRPNVSSGRFTREDIQQKKTNLLFFGNFHQMSLEDYEWGMQETMKDNELLYSSMIRDIYFLGKVLGRKYYLLHISYTVFMFGFVLSVISYAIALIFFPVV
ncbi:MAG: Pycsar system effector family protein [Bacteroidota bacterium]